MKRLALSFCAFCSVLVPVGCGDNDDASYYEQGPEPEADALPIHARIDTDAQLSGREPGRSVGVFIEYLAGGYWSIDVTCDTEVSGYGCSWWVAATAQHGEPFAARAHALESSDDALVVEQSAILVSYTNSDADGFSFRTEPGVALHIDIELDGYAESRFVYWVGEGAVHSGVPRVPFLLEPTRP